MIQEKKESKQPKTAIRMYNVGEYYKIIQKVGRGTYGTVFKAKGLKDGKYYAIKKLENNDTKLQQEGFPITALREIVLLKQIDHPSIINLKEIILSRPSKRNLFKGSTFLVFQYMDHDFAGLFKSKQKFTLPEVKCILRQIIEGMAYLHQNKILHRDIKSANILLNDRGEAKIADFGLGRKIRMQNQFTCKVVTLWYRAPELLLGLKTYTDKVDIWSLGCVVAQFLTGEVLFRKETEFAQIQRIYEICGDFQANGIIVNDQFVKNYTNYNDMRPKKPYKKEIESYLRKYNPSLSNCTIDFVQRLLHLDPSKRLSCEQALDHPFFSEKPLACNKSQIQKMEYEYHEMFRDHSIKIERPKVKAQNLSDSEDKGKRITPTKYQFQAEKYPQIKNKPYRDYDDERRRDRHYKVNLIPNQHRQYRKQYKKISRSSSSSGSGSRRSRDDRRRNNSSSRSPRQSYHRKDQSRKRDDKIRWDQRIKRQQQRQRKSKEYKLEPYYKNKDGHRQYEDRSFKYENKFREINRERWEENRKYHDRKDSFYEIQREDRQKDRRIKQLKEREKQKSEHERYKKNDQKYEFRRQNEAKKPEKLILIRQGKGRRQSSSSSIKSSSNSRDYRKQRRSKYYYEKKDLGPRKEREESHNGRHK